MKRIEKFGFVIIIIACLAWITPYGQSKITRQTIVVVSPPPIQQETNLIEAVVSNRIDIVEKILKDNKTLVNLRDKKGTALIHHAITLDHTEILKILIANEADINIKDKGFLDWTPALHAAGKLDIFKELAKNGANLNIKGKGGRTPLHLQCFRGQPDLAEISIKYGSKVYALSGELQTPLHFTGKLEDPVNPPSDYKKVIELLLANGAKLNAEDSYCRTPLSLAREKNRLNIVNTLLQCGAK